MFSRIGRPGEAAKYNILVLDDDGVVQKEFFQLYGGLIRVSRGVGRRSK